ncbi:glycosyl hydrolase [Daedaleopsis nitida]|nr:glycosyl hydrolase [Daedaleopsis nitida]
MKTTILTAIALLTRLANHGNIQANTSVALVMPLEKPSTPNYNGPYRPQIHFSPIQHFMNDPNGLFLDAEGTYHLYYQYNPTDVVAGNQHWGHATSSDLYHWVTQPVAISPPTLDSQVFSGSVIVDVNNTSGFFPNQTNGVVAIYTLNTPRAQVQEIAYSHDGGYTFARYAGDPVIDSNSTQFRDPKVIWHEETERWVMAIAYAQELVIGFYTSPNLKTWTHASNFTHHGFLGLQYECPNLIRMPVRDPRTHQLLDDSKYVLTISINPGAPLGGSTTQYFPGAFNGTHFTPVDSATRLTDFAKDNYATQFFFVPASSDAAGSDPLSIAWASNWQYAQAAPTAREGWRSAMSLPRRMFLANVSRAGWDLVSRPADLSPVLGPRLAARDDLGHGAERALTVDYSAVESNALYFEANVSGLPAVALIHPDATLNFTFLNPTTGESVSGGYFFGGDTPFFLDRGRTRGFENPFFTDKFSAAVLPREDGTWTLSGVIDRSMIEVFVDGGAYSATATFFPTQPLTVMRMEAAGLPPEASVNVAIFSLLSAWTDIEPVQEFVRG